MDRKYGANTDERKPDGTFAPGNPGKPKGSRHKATQAIEAMLEGQQEALTQAAIDKALVGDVTALRLCLDRIAPVRKDAPVFFELPHIETAQDAASAARAILRAVADGNVTPTDHFSCSLEAKVHKMKINFRHNARKYIKAAKEFASMEDGKGLRAACLELRMAIEALTYVLERQLMLALKVPTDIKPP